MHRILCVLIATQLSICGRRTFAVACPTTWSSLSDLVRNPIPNITVAAVRHQLTAYGTILNELREFHT